MIDSKPKSDQPPVEVPARALGDETLKSLIESFVLREGTDYGAHEVSLDKKIQQVTQQILSGEVKIIFDPETESIHLMTRLDFALKFQLLAATART